MNTVRKFQTLFNSGRSFAVGEPRIRPGTRGELGFVNSLIAGAGGRAVGAPRLNLFAVIGKHRWLLRTMLPFMGRLMPGGKLPRQDTELVILRVGYLTGAQYERHQHTPMALKAGLTQADVERSARPGAAGWSGRHAAVIAAVDELHETRNLSDASWAALKPHYDERQLIELVMLTGAYEMVAMTINTLGVQIESGAACTTTSSS
jgi:alkylhydroperoxidase family enzyme